MDLPTDLPSLAAEPSRLAAADLGLTEKLQTLILDSFSVHVATFRCEADVRQELSAAAQCCEDLESGVSTSAAALPALESSLAQALSEHSRLRRTLGQQSLLLELLEAPGLMETCIRSGLHEEALDISEYATGLYFTHKLWQTLLPPEQRPTAPSAAESRGSAVVGSVVAEIRALTESMRRSLLQSLSSKIALSHALRLLGHLRRLYVQQALAKRRMAAVMQSHVHQLLLQSQEAAASSHSPAAAAAVPSFSVHEFALSAADDVSIVRRLLREYLACRDAWHLSELELISRHNPYQYLLRVIEVQRTHWADLAAQHVAVTTSLLRSLQQQRSAAVAAAAAAAEEEEDAVGASRSPAPAPVDAAAAAAVATAVAVEHRRSREQLQAWLQGRVAWFVSALRECLPAIEDDSGRLPTLLQQAAYAARRAGRLGCDYGHLVAPLFAERVGHCLVGRLQHAGAVFSGDVVSWEWAYRMAYEPESAATATSLSTAAAPAASAAAAAGGHAAAPLALPLPAALLRHAPLADLANQVAVTLNCLRPCLPAACVPLLARELSGLLARVGAALTGAWAADASPAQAALRERERQRQRTLATSGDAAARRAATTSAAAAAAASSGGAGPLRTPEDSAQAVRRFGALCAAAADVFAPALAAMLVYSLKAAELLPAGSPLSLLLVHDAAAAPLLADASSGAVSVGAASLPFEKLRTAGASVHPDFDAAWAALRDTIAALRAEQVQQL